MLYITNKTERFSFKSGCVVWVARCLKEDWFIGVVVAIAALKPLRSAVKKFNC